MKLLVEDIIDFDKANNVRIRILHRPSGVKMSAEERQIYTDKKQSYDFDTIVEIFHGFDYLLRLNSHKENIYTETIECPYCKDKTDLIIFKHDVLLHAPDSLVKDKKLLGKFKAGYRKKLRGFLWAGIFVFGLIPICIFGSLYGGSPQSAWNFAALMMLLIIVLFIILHLYANKNYNKHFTNKYIFCHIKNNELASKHPNYDRKFNFISELRLASTNMLQPFIIDGGETLFGSGTDQLKTLKTVVGYLVKNKVIDTKEINEITI